MRYRNLAWCDAPVMRLWLYSRTAIAAVVKSLPRWLTAGGSIERWQSSWSSPGLCPIMKSVWAPRPWLWRSRMEINVSSEASYMADSQMTWECEMPNFFKTSSQVCRVRSAGEQMIRSKLYDCCCNQFPIWRAAFCPRTVKGRSKSVQCSTVQSDLPWRIKINLFFICLQILGFNQLFYRYWEYICYGWILRSNWFRFQQFSYDRR